MKKLILIPVVLMVASLLLSRNSYAEIYSAIAGKVIAEDTGNGVGGVDVHALAIRSESRQEYTVTDQKGNYIFKKLRPGKYVLTFIKKDSSYITEELNLEVDLPRGKNIVNANYTLKLGGSISGRIYGSDGITPLSNVHVTAEAKNPQPKSAVGLKTVQTDINGKYIIQGLPSSDNCEVTVDILGKTIITKTIKITMGKAVENVNFTAKWDEKTGISGYVKSSIDNNPIRNAEIVLRDKSGNDIGYVFTDTDGKYSIAGLIPGVYKVVAFFPKGGYIKKTDIVVVSGSVTIVNFEFQKLAPISMIFRKIWNQFTDLFIAKAYASSTADSDLLKIGDTSHIPNLGL